MIDHFTVSIQQLSSCLLISNVKTLSKYTTVQKFVDK